jgi:hypothetical protein
MPPGAILRVQLPAILTHRVPTHLDAMGVMNQPVENTIGHRWIADLFVPAGHGQLRREDQRAELISANSRSKNPC